MTTPTSSSAGSDAPEGQGQPNPDAGSQQPDKGLENGNPNPEPNQDAEIKAAREQGKLDAKAEWGRKEKELREQIEKEAREKIEADALKETGKYQELSERLQKDLDEKNGVISQLQSKLDPLEKFKENSEKAAEQKAKALEKEVLELAGDKGKDAIQSQISTYSKDNTQRVTQLEGLKAILAQTASNNSDKPSHNPEKSREKLQSLAKSYFTRGNGKKPEKDKS